MKKPEYDVLFYERYKGALEFTHLHTENLKINNMKDFEDMFFAHDKITTLDEIITNDYKKKRIDSLSDYEKKVRDAIKLITDQVYAYNYDDEELIFSDTQKAINIINSFLSSTIATLNKKRLTPSRP